MKQKILIIFFVLLPFFLKAGIQINITQGINSSRPISIVPFKYNGVQSAPEDISEIITNDLKNSGKFNILSINLMPQFPSTISEVTKSDWISLGIDKIVIGTLQITDDQNYIISYQLINTYDVTETVIIQNQYITEKQWLRNVAHNISDEIFKELTGIFGSFSTRIAYIIFNQNKEYPYELCIADYDGYNQVVIFSSLEPLMSPAWSPDGKKIAYVTFTKGRSMLVMQTISDGNINTIVSFPHHNGAPSFSPDGKKLAFALSKTGSLHIYVMDLQSKKIQQITYGRNNNTEPNWFPDNKTLAYTSDQGGNPQIYKININNGKPERLSWIGIKNQNVNISTDGKFVVVVNRDQEQHIAKLNLLTGSFKILTDTLLDETPSISPNGAMIIYSSSQGFYSVLQLVSSDGQYKTCLLKKDGHVRFPAWGPILYL